MPTAAVVYAPQSGHSRITLTGTIETDAQFSVQPATNDQIVYPTALTVDAQLNISGPADSYILWHMTASGVAYNTSYDIVNLSAPVLSGATFNQITASSLRFQVQTDKAGGTWYVLIGTSMPADGSVISTGVSAAVSSAGVLSHTFSGLTAAKLYYAKAVHVDADTNVSNYATATQSTYASGSISVPVVFSPPTGFTVATLEAGYNTQTLQQWPEVIADNNLVGWQLVSEAALGHWDSMGNYEWYSTGVHDYWAISPAGVAYYHTIDTTGLSSAVPLDLADQSVTGTEINTWTAMPDQIVLSIDAATSAISSIDNSQAQQRVSTDGGATFDAWSSTQRTGLSTGAIIELRIMSGPDYSNTGSDYSRSAQITINGVSFTISATNRAAVVPTITAQPQALTISQGADGTFTITGTNIDTVEWTYDGVVVSGQAGTTLTIADAATGTHTIDGIAYSAEGGATALDAAVLTVLSDGVLPVITLLGANPLQLIQGTAYVEPGYTATDNVDGDLTADVVVTGTVDHTTPNQYSLTYSVTDTAGNVGSRVRVVNVVAASVTAAFPFAQSTEWDGGKTPTLVIGDTFQHRITLLSNGTSYNASQAASIKANVVAGDHSVEYCDEVGLSSAYIGADWSAGQIIVYMTGDQTAAIADFVSRDSMAKMEIQVEVGADKFTWLAAIRLVPGFIQ